MSTPVGDVMFSPADSTTASASSNIGNTATAYDSVTTTETLYYAYDTNGVPISLIYTDTEGTTATYYYATNIQGDVTAILDTTGIPVVEYTYDAWGNPLTTTGTMADTLGKANSLRYRGYVYDSETGLYYLQSRYYNPEMGRYINADAFTSTGQGFLGFNMFAYCGNNAAIFCDPDGYRYVHYPLLDGGASSKKKSTNQKITAFAKTVWQDAKKVSESVWHNTDASLGIGLGLYANIGLIDFAGLGIGIYENVASVHLDGGTLIYGQELYMGCTVTAFQEFGAAEYKFMQDGNEIASYSWSGTNLKQETISIIGGGVYFFGGFSFDIGFNFTGFFKDLEAIFHDK